jgi:hypothetical protein
MHIFLEHLMARSHVLDRLFFISRYMRPIYRAAPPSIAF